MVDHHLKILTSIENKVLSCTLPHRCPPNALQFAHDIASIFETSRPKSKHMHERQRDQRNPNTIPLTMISPHTIVNKLSLITPYQKGYYIKVSNMPQQGFIRSNTQW
jgi:hypothetical protein